jgi:hypothetical protein
LKKREVNKMRITILRRLEALEEKYRSYEQKEWSSLRTARTYIWMIVLAYYLGDLRPEDDDPHSAYDRVVKLPRDHDFSAASIQKAGLEYRNRLNDAYCRFFVLPALNTPLPLLLPRLGGLSFSPDLYRARNWSSCVADAENLRPSRKTRIHVLNH